MRVTTCSGILVAACLIAPRVASADAIDDARKKWLEDTVAISHEFWWPDDLDPVFELTKGVEPDCTPVLPESLYDDLTTDVSAACTVTLATSDRDLCRAAAIALFMETRADDLAAGVDRGFRFVASCGGGFDVTGVWNRYGPSVAPDDGILTARQDTGTGSTATYRIQLAWSKLAPQPDIPRQWASAVIAPADKIEGELDRMAHDIDAGDATDTRSWVLDRIDSTLDEVRAFPELPGDDSVRTAVIAWLTATRKDLEKGALKKIVDRTHSPNAAKASYAKKTRAMMKKWQKSRTKRGAKLDRVVDAFDRKHPDE